MGEEGRVEHGTQTTLLRHLLEDFGLQRGDAADLGIQLVPGVHIVIGLEPKLDRRAVDPLGVGRHPVAQFELGAAGNQLVELLLLFALADVRELVTQGLLDQSLPVYFIEKLLRDRFILGQAEAVPVHRQSQVDLGAAEGRHCLGHGVGQQKAKEQKADGYGDHALDAEASFLAVAPFQAAAYDFAVLIHNAPGICAPRAGPPHSATA